MAQTILLDSSGNPIERRERLPRRSVNISRAAYDSASDNTGNYNYWKNASDMNFDSAFLGESDVITRRIAHEMRNNLVSKSIARKFAN
ncbi:MAG: hypothetical protein JXR97_06015, partial [Planctomycetes bacterium]|nr:hypothetical protein [Planctomycetota bacterium]